MNDGIKTKDIHDVLVMVVRSFIERDPAHSLVAARLLLQSIYREVLGEVDFAKFDEVYRQKFIESIKYGISVGQFDPRMAEFDLTRMPRRCSLSATKTSNTWASRPCRPTTSPRSTAPSSS